MRLAMTPTRRKPKRVALYLRVSTTEQTTRNQRRELKAVADRHGWEIVKVYEDAGVSGAKGRDKRAGLNELMKAVARREIDMVAAWSVDRLGRSLMTCSACSRRCTPRALISSCINRVWTRRHPQAEPCFRCSVCSRSSSAP